MTIDEIKKRYEQGIYLYEEALTALKTAGLSTKDAVHEIGPNPHAVGVQRGVLSASMLVLH